jgi:hypothetical protein
MLAEGSRNNICLSIQHHFVLHTGKIRAMSQTDLDLNPCSDIY